jgi:hypothetical protein
MPKQISKPLPTGTPPLQDRATPHPSEDRASPYANESAARRFEAFKAAKLKR